MAQHVRARPRRRCRRAVPVADGVQNLISNATAMAVFRPGERHPALPVGRGGRTRKLVWRDREGRVTGSLGDNAVYYDVALATGRRGGGDGGRDLGGRRRLVVRHRPRRAHAADLRPPRRVARRLVAGRAGTVAFASNRAGHYDLYTLAVGGAQPEQLLHASDNPKVPCSISPDGRTLLYQEQTPRPGGDIL